MPRRPDARPRGIRLKPRALEPDRYEINFTDQHGVRRFELAGTELRAAKRLRAQRLREVREGTYQPAGGASGASKLRDVAERWAAEKRRQGKRSVDDNETHVRLHIGPVFGDVAVAEIRPADVARFVDGLAGKLSAKSIRNVHGTLHAILEHARFEEAIIANPAHLPRGRLPAVGKKRKARFTREECWQLLTDPAIPDWRSIFYALQALGGLRLGEASGRRWRDIDRDTPHLWALTVDTQYDDQPLKTAKGEDTRERLVPVHPALQELLEGWRREGFAELFGRHPRPDDWLCPDPRTGEPRTQNQAVKALYRDCNRVEIPRRGCHAFRHAFISLARSDGARKDVLRTVTHNAVGDIVDGYTEWEWAPLCEAVGSLRFNVERAVVSDLERGPKRGAHPVDPGISSGGGGSRKGSLGGGIVELRGLTPGGGRPGVPPETGKITHVPHDVTQATLARAVRLLRDAGHGAEADAVKTLIRHRLHSANG